MCQKIFPKYAKFIAEKFCILWEFGGGSGELNF